MKHTNARQKRERNRQIREFCVETTVKMRYMDGKLGRKPRISESAKRISVMK